MKTASQAVSEALATLGQMFLDNKARRYTGARCAKILARAAILLTQGEGAEKTDAAYPEAAEVDGVMLAAPKLRALLEILAGNDALTDRDYFSLPVREALREARKLLPTLKPSEAVRHG